MTWPTILLFGTFCIGISLHDGDTFTDSQCTKRRLWGVDAVELDQLCDGDGCGIFAREALRNIVAHGEVSCVDKGTSYDRVVSQCWVNGVDIGRQMVRLGWAIDVPNYSHGEYDAEMREARSARRGIWGYRNVMTPANWRKRHARYSNER